MGTTADLRPEVLVFIEEQIDSVPHLEALLLLWRSAPESWTRDQIAARIYVAPETAAGILSDLARRGLVKPTGEDLARFAFDPGWDRSRELMESVAAAHREKLILVAHRIHQKASGAVREFARAFEIKKED
jgi:hypothetical protein